MPQKISPEENAYQLAYNYEQVKEHCAQATLAAIMESIGWIDENVFQAADGLTGGTALSSEGTCGALAAGILAVSRITGRTYQNFQSNQPGYKWEQIIALSDRFKEKYGGISGCDVQKRLFGCVYSLRDPSEREIFTREGAHVDKCPSVCGDVAKWSVEIIAVLKDAQAASM
ncbi:MAG: C_GCAxxG_C_C family protein [Anaerolineales bacterium]|nr:C_GCAxxG_C_C family protein [Anaerolineales bacterium]